MICKIMPHEHLVTILHVDDNEANRYVVSRMLRNAGFEVKEAATGEDSLQLIAQDQPDLIILDVKLPDIDGFEVCRRIKANPATSSIPVLHLSAKFVKTEDKAQGLECGADGYLAQPVEQIELIATIKALLRVRKAEESALNLAREWQTTFDAISDGVCLLDKEGNIVRCNKAFQSLINNPPIASITSDYPKLNLQPIPIVSIIQESGEKAKLLNLFEGLKTTKNREKLEVYLGEKWFSITADPMFDRELNFNGAVYIITDITERVHNREALIVSEERFRLLLENVLDYAIFFMDNNGYISKWSTGAEQILGYQTAEILGKYGGIIFTPEDLECGAEKEELEKAASEGRADNERWHLRKNGSRFWASGIVTPLRDESGQLRGFAKIMRDFTERKRAEDERNLLLAREQEARAQAEAANRMKDEFLATLSHELRSPLNAMLGWAQLLNSRKFDERTTSKALDVIERTAKLQAQLVDDLLDVSRIIQGKLMLNIRPVELEIVIGAVFDTVLPAAQAKEIQFSRVLQPSVGLVAGDPDRLQQVLWNLLSNAIKFTPNGGRVEVRLERIHSQVQITVTDTGKGINPDFVPYVFDRFSQADSSITRSYSGLGLGLAIVRHLVELHGGTVHAESEGDGLGATFMVKFPIMPVRGSEVDSQRISNLPGKEAAACLGQIPPLNDLQVLIVDDDQDTRLFITTVLLESGAKVIEASSAKEGLESLKKHKPDVLISDIGMPDEDGYSLISKVRALTPEEGGQIPAAALTAYARPEDRARSLLEGFQIHISKPVEPSELAAVVANLAGRVSVRG